MENVGWQIVRAGRYKGTIYDTDFDGTEKLKRAQVSVQSDEEMLAEATKIEDAWPHETNLTQRRKGAKN